MSNHIYLASCVWPLLIHSKHAPLSARFKMFFFFVISKCSFNNYVSSFKRYTYVFYPYSIPNPPIFNSVGTLDFKLNISCRCAHFRFISLKNISLFQKWATRQTRTVYISSTNIVRRQKFNDKCNTDKQQSIRVRWCQRKIYHNWKKSEPSK